MTFETFDHLTYKLNIGKATADKYPVTVELTADLPKDRTPAKDEKPEDKEKADKDFEAEQKKLRDKVAKEKNYEHHIYQMAKNTLDNYLKERPELLAPPKPAANSEGAPPGTGHGSKKSSESWDSRKNDRGDSGRKCTAASRFASGHHHDPPEPSRSPPWSTANSRSGNAAELLYP